MNMAEDLLALNLADVAALIRNKQVSPVEVTSAALERIEQLNPRMNAFYTVTAEIAREQAEEAEREIAKGEYRSPLHGVPVALKDLVYTAGVRTTAGSKILEHFVPGYDATVVSKLREAGAVLIGKTALHEFAYGITNDNPHFGPTRNPWDPSRVSGGSSGGSAVALATGMCFGAVGTDTGGSIRIPSSFCGTAGLKPTFGRVSAHGVYPLGPTLDHVGPMARAVVDLGILYQILSGHDEQDVFSVDRPLGEIGLSRSLPSVRIGIPEDYLFEAVDPEVEQAVRKVLQVLGSLGAKIATVRLPDMAELTEVSRRTLLAEALAGHEEHFTRHSDKLGADLKLLFEKGGDWTAVDYFRAQMTRRRLRRELEHTFQNVDVLLTPTTPLTAFPIGDNGDNKVVLGGQQEDARGASTRLLRCFNASGHPALSLCCGFDSAGLPIGVQFVGRLWDEARVLQAGYAYEQATEWHKRRPPLA